ncbi:serine aminopeptidase domain-containing protein [Conexibacter sp. DBS9H8]|uniref:serine aminopeptidase domain-containing protein n=1 Tax=Conexibacter sp. DBS9H8 TaxID=2937801 RepID=UPI002010A1D2|nr:alpha/beta hydrolase [Conexibacter sp. DBS9H8]
MTGSARWRRVGAAAIYSVLHEDESGAVPTVAVLMVPPFGWAEVETHRARRDWAIRLARHGIPCLRFDLPGTGDSAGHPRDPGLFRTWIATVTELAASLRTETGAARIAVLGTGLGGLIAVQALGEGAEFDDLVLWAVEGTGRAALREMRLYARIVASRHPLDDEREQDDPGLAVAGFYVSEETRNAILDYDVAAMSFPPGVGRRALLISQDTVPVDEALRAGLRGAGLSVDVAVSRDYADFRAHPQSLTLRRPLTTIRRVAEWLAGPAQTSRAVSERPPPVRVDRGTVTERIGEAGGGVVESIVDIVTPTIATPVVICEPPPGQARQPFLAVFLSAGAIRKTGPHRLWVEAARRWAARGVVSVRFDIPGVGDAGGRADSGDDERGQVSDVGVNSPATISAVAEAVQVLRHRGLPENLMFVGFCSGGYLGVMVALSDPRVRAVTAVNLEGFAYSEDLYQLRMIERIGAVARQGGIRRLRQGVSRHQVLQFRAALSYWIRSGFRHRRSLDRRDVGRLVVDRMLEQHVAVTLINSRSACLYDELGVSGRAEAAERWPELAIHELPSEDHMACVLWLQEMIHERLDGALDRVSAELSR